VVCKGEEEAQAKKHSHRSARLLRRSRSMDYSLGVVTVRSGRSSCSRSSDIERRASEPRKVKWKKNGPAVSLQPSGPELGGIGGTDARARGKSSTRAVGCARVL
jgi:hypothetical protein